MKKKNRSVYIVLIIVLLIGVTIGYAALNATLNINGRSNVSKNTWELYFDNVVVKSDSVGEVKTPTIENNTTVDFEVALNLPGEKYEFTVDVVNNGTIDAMIESINKTPDLTIEQQKYLNYIVEYENEVQVLPNQLVKSKEFVRLKVKVEYKKDIDASDLPANTETLNLGFTINYIQADGNKIGVRDNGVFKVKANSSLDEIGTIVTIGTEQFYTIGTEGNNVLLFAKYNLYVGSECTLGPLTCIPYGDEATGMQDENMIAFIDSSTASKGAVPFSTDEQKGTYYSSYNGSLVEKYVLEYVAKLENKYGIDIKESRLITRNELISDKFGCSTSNCSKAYTWINSTKYWTFTSYDSTSIYGLDNSSNITTLYYTTSHYAGVRPVLVMSKEDIVVDESPTAFGDINEVGTFVTIGSEQFYSLGVENDNVKLFAATNLYVGSECTSNVLSSCTPYGDEATGMQNDMMRGHGIGNLRRGIIPFSTDEQKGATYFDYNGSLVDVYVNNYKNLLKVKFDIDVKEAKVLSKDDLISIGCTSTSCKNTYSWIYSTSYWSSTSTGTGYIYSVGYNGSVGYATYDNAIALGVRPVIVISKDYF